MEIKLSRYQNFLEILKKKAKVKIYTKVDKKLLRKQMLQLQIPNSNKFKKHTNWKPLIPFEESLEKIS